MSKAYSKEEINKLQLEFNRSAPLSKLEKILVNRTTCGIVMKLKKLSKEDPDTWNPERVNEYEKIYRGYWYKENPEKKREYSIKRYNKHKKEVIEYQLEYYETNKDKLLKKQKKYYKKNKDEINKRVKISSLKNEFPELQIFNIDYKIKSILFEENRLIIKIDEQKEEMDMETVIQHYKSFIRKLPYNIDVDINYDGKTIVLSPNFENKRKRVIQRSIRFLEVHEILQNEKFL